MVFVHMFPNKPLGSKRFLALPKPTKKPTLWHLTMYSPLYSVVKVNGNICIFIYTIWSVIIKILLRVLKILLIIPCSLFYQNMTILQNTSPYYYTFHSHFAQHPTLNRKGLSHLMLGKMWVEWVIGDIFCNSVKNNYSTF